MIDFRIPTADFDAFRHGFECVRLGTVLEVPAYIVVDQISYERGVLFARQIASTGFELQPWAEGVFLPPYGANKAFAKYQQTVRSLHREKERSSA